MKVTRQTSRNKIPVQRALKPEALVALVKEERTKQRIESFRTKWQDFLYLVVEK